MQTMCQNEGYGFLKCVFLYLMKHVSKYESCEIYNVLNYSYPYSQLFRSYK